MTSACDGAVNTKELQGKVSMRPEAFPSSPSSQPFLPPDGCGRHIGKKNQALVKLYRRI